MSAEMSRGDQSFQQRGPVTHLRQNPLDAVAASKVESPGSEITAKATSPAYQTPQFIHLLSEASDFAGQVANSIPRASHRANSPCGRFHIIASRIQFSKQAAAMKMVAKFRPQFIGQAANRVSLGFDSTEVE
jgi:hypothetical protein